MMIMNEASLMIGRNFLKNCSLVGAIIATSQTAWAQSLTLAENGKATAVIVLADRPSSQAQAAAKELRRYLTAVSGAEFLVKQEKELSPPEKNGAQLLVGDSDLVRQAEIRIADLPPEGFLHKTIGNKLVLAGREDEVGGALPQQGTHYAVSAFLEEQLGVRWLWPGASGEVIPQKAKIAINELDRKDAPALVQRQMRDLMENRSPRFSVPRELMRVTPEQHAAMQQVSAEWLLRQRLGGRVKLSAPHAFTKWWDLYHEKHPDWFAMHLNGSRDWPERLLGEHERVKICVSNPEVLEQFVANAISSFKGKPGALAFSASPNDSAMTGNCMCPTCKSWDVAEAPKVELSSIDVDGKRVSFEYPSLSDRYMRFYNLAAERLEKAVPGKFIIGISYGAWKTPPVREKPRDNVIIGHVGFNSYMSDSDRANTLAEWDGLTRVTKHMFLRPNTLYHSYGFPLVFTHRMAADLRHCFDTGMMGVDYDSLIHHWGGNGLNYYVLGKLLWNPHADVDAIVADYCQSGFGAAAPAIQRYFDAVEQQTNRIAAINAWRRGKIPEQEMIPLWTQEVMGELQGHLDQARTLAAADVAILERIAVLQVGMDYVRLQLAAMTAIEREKQEATPANKAAKQAALEARQQFYRQYKTSFAINVPMLLFRQQSRSDLFYGVNNAEAQRLLQQMEDEQA